MRMLAFFPAVLLTSLPLLTGCHSRYVEATLTNHTEHAISVIQVDYPSATFGTQGLPPGGSFHYRFKLLGEGPVKVSWTDDTRHDHTSSGPTLHEGAEGALQIGFEPGDRVDFRADLHSR